MKTYTALLVVILFASACGNKKTAIAPPPPPMQVPPPSTGNTGGQRSVITEFVVEPSSVERGQSAQLRWAVTNATAASINRGIGTIPLTGTQRVTPGETTTYTLTASGAAGDVTASATLTVTGPGASSAPTD